jgi:hypothetical protein
MAPKSQLPLLARHGLPKGTDPLTCLPGQCPSLTQTEHIALSEPCEQVHRTWAFKEHLSREPVIWNSPEDGMEKRYPGEATGWCLCTSQQALMTCYPAAKSIYSVLARKKLPRYCQREGKLQGEASVWASVCLSEMHCQSGYLGEGEVMAALPFVSENSE